MRSSPRQSSPRVRRVPHTVAALLLGAGAGLRLGASVPKAFCEVAGRTLLAYSYQRFASHPLVRDVIVIVPASMVDQSRSLLPDANVVAGGVTRLDSVRVGLAALADDVDTVLAHDVARAFVPAAVIDRVIGALVDGVDAVVPAIAMIDTVKRVGADDRVIATLDRSQLRAVQTPQAFRRAALVAAHADAPEATDDASLIEAAGGVVVIVEGADEAFKITRPWDLRLAATLAVNA
jgi:2-C-methyl-D-erythritol 4-phosphate cytidylyltransferase